MSSPDEAEADLEQLAQEDALFPWLADDSMADAAESAPEPGEW